MILLYCILTVSLRFILLTGQMNFAHGAFVGIGAYTSALLVMKLGLNFWIAILLAGLSASLFAFVIGIITLRIKGAYFALAMFGLGAVFELALVRWSGLTGGVAGIINIPVPNSLAIGAFTIDFSGKRPFYYLILLILLVALFIMVRLEKSKLGLIFQSILEADTLSEAVGINPLRYKLLAMLVGCFFAGIAGSFYAHYEQFIGPNSFDMFDLTLWIVLYVMIGGMGSWVGPIVGTTVLLVISELLRSLGTYVPLIYGALLVIIMVFLPDGLIGLWANLKPSLNMITKSRSNN